MTTAEAASSPSPQHSIAIARCTDAALISLFFYDRLLADFAEHPRTIMLSTHLIDEVADLLEHVIMLDHGRVVLDAPADEVRGAAVTVSGSAKAVDEFVAGRQIWHQQRVTSLASAVVPGPLDSPRRPAPARCA